MVELPLVIRLGQALAQLNEDPACIPWPARRDLVRTAADALGDDGDRSVVLPLFHTLAADPKWEVRKEVAELLFALPEEDFARLAASLSEDPNAFVRGAAERSLGRRRKSPLADGRKPGPMANVTAQFRAFEKQYGRAAAESAVGLAEQLTDVIVGEIVHGVRGVLTPLKAGTAALVAAAKEADAVPAAFGQRLERMADQIDFMERIVDDARDYSRAQALERRPERLAELVETAAVMVEDELHASGRDTSAVGLNLDIEDGLTVEVARSHMLVAIANVLRNAYDAIDGKTDDADIWVITRSVGLEARVTVEDNGPGLDAEDLCAIREFVPGRTSKKRHGTGFGLPIAHRHLRAHGGDLTIESVLDQGTTVTLIIPLTQSPDS